MKTKDSILPGEDWEYRPASKNQLSTMYRLEAFAQGLKEAKMGIDETNLTMIEAHKRINIALKQIKTNIQTGGTVTNYVMSSEEWDQIYEEVASGDVFRGGLSEQEWKEFQYEIYKDLEEKGIVKTKED